MRFDYRTPESPEWNGLDGRPDLVLLSRKQQDGSLDLLHRNDGWLHDTLIGEVECMVGHYEKGVSLIVCVAGRCGVAGPCSFPYCAVPPPFCFRLHRLSGSVFRSGNLKPFFDPEGPGDLELAASCRKPPGSASASRMGR